MRPVDKGLWPTKTKTSTNKRVFTNWTRALPYLKDRTGWYCHLCEMRVNNHMSIEHIKSRTDYPLLSKSWTNFLLSCGYCNSRKNSQNLQFPYRKKYVWPHIHNTLMVFEVPLLGKDVSTIQPRGSMPQAIIDRAKALIDLYALDAITTKDGAADVRFIERLEAIQLATSRRVEFAKGVATPQSIVDMAKKSGFFSVWFDVFSSVPTVKLLLLTEQAFKINLDWFDPVTLDPICRIPAEGI